MFLQLFMDLHVFYPSHRFGLIFHVFQQFFVPFFVPAKREKKGGFYGAILVIRDSWAMGTAGLTGSLVVAMASRTCYEPQVLNQESCPCSSLLKLPTILPLVLPAGRLQLPAVSPGIRRSWLAGPMRWSKMRYIPDSFCWTTTRQAGIA